MSSKTLEIIQGLAQAAANAWDGAHDERFVRDGEQKKAGLNREEGCPIMDERINDGFRITFHGHQICIKYQSDILLKDVHSGGFENDISRMINEVKKYLQKEYKKITGNSITLTKVEDPQILVQSSSRVRSWVQAYQYYNVSGLKVDPDAGGSENRKVDDAIKKFLSLKSDKKPSNVTRK